jgi:hypothetical protein
MSQDTEKGYAGAGWVKAMTGQTMSPFGENVADLLGDLFLGIYHIERDVRRAELVDPRLDQHDLRR